LGGARAARRATSWLGRGSERERSEEREKRWEEREEGVKQREREADGDLKFFERLEESDGD
jgi:hypothetical protein